MPKGSWLEYPVSPRAEDMESGVREGVLGGTAGHCKVRAVGTAPDSSPPLSCCDHVHCSVAQTVTPRLRHLPCSPPLFPLVWVSYLNIECRHRVTRGRANERRSACAALSHQKWPPKPSEASKCRRTSQQLGHRQHAQNGL